MKIEFCCYAEKCKALMTRQMAASEAYLCSICNDGKEMHVWCCDEHRKQLHGGAGQSVPQFTKEGLKEHYRQSKEYLKSKNQIRTENRI